MTRRKSSLATGETGKTKRRPTGHPGGLTNGGASLAVSSPQNSDAGRLTTSSDVTLTLRLVALVTVALAGCSSAPPASSAAHTAPGAVAAVEPAILALADSIFAAARARDPDRFASFFSDRPDFAYLINTHRLGSREALQATFRSMLSRQLSFDPRWGSRTVQTLTPHIGVLTGEFETKAQRIGGEAWTASGVITFVAVRDSIGWRVVNWHTSE